MYKKNDDIDFILKQVDWNRMVREVESDLTGKLTSAEIEATQETYAMILETVGKVAEELIRKNAGEVDATGCSLEKGRVILPPKTRENLAKLSELGVMGLMIPTAFGGLNCPSVISSTVLEIISTADASLQNFIGLAIGVAEAINEFGSEELKQKYLPKLATGEKTAAMVLTEADSGSDLSHIRTKATFDEKENVWRISGAKRFITNGCGEILVVLARSEAHEGTRGLSFFVVENNADVEITKVEHKMGIHGSPTCEMYFNNAKAYLIGERGKGLTRYMISLMNHARLGTSAQSCGIAQAAYDVALKYAEERVQFGKKIKDIPRVANILADMKITLESIRNIFYTTSELFGKKLFLEKRLMSEGVSDQEMKKNKAYRALKKLSAILTPLSKYYSSEKCNKLAYDCVQVLGGNGYIREFAADRLYRDARITPIYEGTSQIQASMAAGGLLTDGLEGFFDDLQSLIVPHEKLAQLLSRVNVLRQRFNQACEYIREKKDEAYKELTAEWLARLACDLVASYVFLKHAGVSARKELSAQKFITDAEARSENWSRRILSGDRLVLDHWDTIIYGGN
jgi:alkylation response protein AidB-like acyl-CoA dehydrogenase